MTINQAMVLAAGLGTRMRPLTETLPKPLVKVGGKALIDYALDALVEAGVEKIVVNVHHFADQMLAHLNAYDKAQIIISDERDGLMNSGGGLARGLKRLDQRPLFVMNADLFWIGEAPEQPSNLRKLAGFFQPERMDMAMLCVDNDDTTGHNGKLDFDIAEDGVLSRYKAGDTNPVVYAGAIAMHPALFDDAPADAFNLNIYFDKAIARRRLFGRKLAGHWVTVGTPEAIGQAEETMRRLAVSA